MYVRSGCLCVSVSLFCPLKSPARPLLSADLHLWTGPVHCVRHLTYAIQSKSLHYRLLVWKLIVIVEVKPRDNSNFKCVMYYISNSNYSVVAI